MDETLRAEGRYDVEEMGAGFVHFENGATMDVMAAWALHINATVPGAVAGTLGGVTMPALPGGRDEKPRFFSTLTDPWTDRELDTDGLRAAWAEAGIPDAYDSPQHHWVRVLQGKVELLPTAEIALNMILIAEGIYCSAEEDREIRADEITG
jgi:predicted dehydrogenase